MNSLGFLMAAQDLPSMVHTAHQAESAGFDMVWTSELHRTVFLPLAAIAEKTERMNLGAGVALAFTRSPFVTALNALDLDELSNGRLVLGLGPGVRRLNERWHAATYGAPAHHLRECVEVVRMIIEKAHLGEPMTYSGKYYNIEIRGYKRPFSPARPSIPIYMAGVGPVMCATAGRVADGWLGHMLNSPRWFQEVIQPNVAKGLKQSGRKPTDFTFMPTLTCAIGSDRKEALRAAAGTVAFYASVRTYMDFFSWHGFGEEAQRVQEAFHRGEITAAVDAVSEEMVNTFAVDGTRDDVDKRVRAFKELAGNLTLSAPQYFIPEDQVTHCQEAILQTYGK